MTANRRLPRSRKASSWSIAFAWPPDLLGGHKTELKKRQHHIPESIVSVILRNPSPMTRDVLTQQVQYKMLEWSNQLA